MYVIVFGTTMFVIVMVILLLGYRTAKLTAWERHVSKEFLEKLDKDRVKEITKMMRRQNIFGSTLGSTLDFHNSWLGYLGHTFSRSYCTRNEIHIKVTPWVDWGMRALLDIAIYWQPETLDLSHGNFGDDAAKYLAVALHKMPKLKELKVNNNRFGVPGLTAIAKALKKTTLEKLDIWSNDFYNPEKIDLMTILRKAWGDRKGLNLWYVD